MFSDVGRRIHSILFRILVGFLIVVIPLYGISIVIYSVGVRKQRDSASKEIFDRAQSGFDALEAELRLVLNIQQSYIVDYDLQLLSIRSDAPLDFELRAKILATASSLRTLTELSDTIGNASVHLPVIDRTVSLRSGIRPLASAEFYALADMARESSGGTVILPYDDRLFLYASFPVPTTRGLDMPFFGVTVELSTDALAAKLAGISPAGGSAAFVDPGGGWRVLRDTPASPRENASEGDILTSLLDLVTWNAGTPEMGRHDKETYLVVGLESRSPELRMLVYSPASEIVRPLGELAIWFGVVSAVAVLLSVLFSYWIYRIIVVPLRKLADGFKRVEDGDLGVSLSHPHMDEFRSLYDAFSSMVDRLDRVIHEVSEQRSRARYAELKQLQYQINPHFLYNSIFSISRMARRHHDERLTHFVELLAHYFEFITKSGDDVVSLEEEVHHVRNYIEIQRVRFGRRVTPFLEELPEELSGFGTPRLILQPVVENAYEHGLRNTMVGGLLAVRFANSPAEVRVEVEDNGQELTDQTLARLQAISTSPPENANSSGLQNVHRRLRLHFDDESGLRFSRSKSGGLRVEIVMHTGGEIECRRS